MLRQRQLGEGLGREWGVLGELGRNEPGECPQLASWAPGQCRGAAKQRGLGSSHTLRGVSWAGADWCLNRILAAGEGSIAGDWEDSCWKTGPRHLLLLLLSSTPIPAIGKPSAQREKGPTSQPGLV